MVNQSLPAELRSVWEKAYKMALRRFTNDTKAAKVADQAVARAKVKMGKSEQDEPFAITTEVTKVDEDQGLVYGWFYLCKEDGQVVVDHSDEVLDEYELEKGFVNFMLDSRAGGEMHVRKSAGEEHSVATFVGGMVFTDETVAALGIGEEFTKRGGFGIVKVHDPDVLAKVKSGEYSMFSIGGSGKRKLLDGSADKSASKVVDAVRAEISKAESLEDLSESAVAYLHIQGAASATEALEKGKGPNRHGPSIKCPDIYEALRREGKTKRTAAKISNECWRSPQCNCH